MISDPVVKETSIQVEKGLKAIIPVKSGRARASWGHYDPSWLTPPHDSTADDAIWEESFAEVLQGSTVPYMEMLNSGHSKVAPAGFIDVAAQLGTVLLIKNLNHKLQGVT